jgi:hypothetical protein
METDYRVAFLQNYYSAPESEYQRVYQNNESVILTWRSYDGGASFAYNYPEIKKTYTKLPLIPFVSELITSTRINTLILFS